MSEIIPEMSFTEFKKLKAGELKELQSFEVISDGEHLMTVIIPQTGYIQDSVQNLAQLSNSVGGKDIPIEKEIMEERNG